MTDCIANPSGCGYPDLSDTGVPSGTTLTTVTGNIVLSTRGQTITNTLFTGNIEITAPNVTLNDDEVMVANSTDSAIKVDSSATNTLIENTTVTGLGDQQQSVEYAINNKGATGLVAQRVQLVKCTECFAGQGKLVDSYADVNVTKTGAHYEDSYSGGGNAANNPLTFEHDTLVNQQSGVTTVYIGSDFGAPLDITVDNCLLDGGGWTLYGSTRAGSGGSNVVVTNNRIATDMHPNGGRYGWMAYWPGTSGTGNVLTGNVWDANGEPVPTTNYAATGPTEAGPST
jgi:hypothetical protein